MRGERERETECGNGRVHGGRAGEQENNILKLTALVGTCLQ